MCLMRSNNPLKPVDKKNKPQSMKSSRTAANHFSWGWRSHLLFNPSVRKLYWPLRNLHVKNTFTWWTTTTKNKQSKTHQKNPLKLAVVLSRHWWFLPNLFPPPPPSPSYISGVHHFWVRFLRMWPFFNPTIKVVIFRLRGWCVLGVFLLPAFTRLGHDRQDLLSPCDEMHVCTD